MRAKTGAYLLKFILKFSNVVVSQIAHRIGGFQITIRTNSIESDCKSCLALYGLLEVTLWDINNGSRTAGTACI